MAALNKVGVMDKLNKKGKDESEGSDEMPKTLGQRNKIPESRTGCIYFPASGKNSNKFTNKELFDNKISAGLHCTNDAANVCYDG